MALPFKKSNPLRIQAGAQKAELATLRALANELRAKVSRLQNKLETGWQQTAAHLRAKYDIALALGPDGCPSPEALQAAWDELDGYFVRQQQLAEGQVAACGFDPHGREKLAELNKALANCFKPER